MKIDHHSLCLADFASSCVSKKAIDVPIELDDIKSYTKYNFVKEWARWNAKNNQPFSQSLETEKFRRTSL